MLSRKKIFILFLSLALALSLAFTFSACDDGDCDDDGADLLREIDLITDFSEYRDMTREADKIEIFYSYNDTNGQSIETGSLVVEDGEKIEEIMDTVFSLRYVLYDGMIADASPPSAFTVRYIEITEGQTKYTLHPSSILVGEVSYRTSGLYAKLIDCLRSGGVYIPE